MPAQTKTRISQELTPAQLEEFCNSLKDVAHGDLAVEIQKRAAELGIVIGKSAAYGFKNNELVPWLERIKERRQKAELIAELGADTSGMTLADAAAAELGQMCFDMVTKLDGGIDITTKNGRATLDQISKTIKRLRDSDRAMIRQLQTQIEDTKKDLSDKGLTETDRAARMRARFGVKD